MSSVSLLDESGGDSAVVTNMHNDSATASIPFISMLGKTHMSHQKVMNGYLSHWGKEKEAEKAAEDSDEAIRNRENQYESLVNGYVPGSPLV